MIDVVVRDFAIIRAVDGDAIEGAGSDAVIGGRRPRRGLKQIYADVIGGDGVVLSNHLARLKEQDASRDDVLRGVDGVGDEVIPDVCCRAAAHLDSVLRDKGGRADARDLIVRDLRARAEAVTPVSPFSDNRQSTLPLIVAEPIVGRPLVPPGSLVPFTATTQGLVPDMRDSFQQCWLDKSSSASSSEVPQGVPGQGR